MNCIPIMSQYNPKQFWDDASEDADVRYKYIADEWATTEDFLSFIEENNSEWNKVLEIGCGIGRLIVPLADKYEQCKFYGIDISDKMIAKAPKRSNIEYQCSGYNLDLVYSMLVFQHITDTEKELYVETAYKMLKKDGVFLLQVVVGKEQNPYSYQVSEGYIGDVLKKSGFRDIKLYMSYLHEQWLFIKAIK